MPSSEPGLGAAMRRVPRWWLIPAVVVLVLSGLIAAYWAGSTTDPGATPAQTVTPVVPVSAMVERRAVVKQVTISGKVIAGAQVAVKAAPSPGVDRLVVTSAAKAAGDRVAPGELLAVVSGRPLLILPSSVPLYRDIASGDSGPDVTALQGALAGFGYSVAVTGTFNAATQRAISAWYEAAGSKAPTGVAASDAVKQGTMKQGMAVPDVGTAQTTTSGTSAPAVVVRWREFVQIPGDTGRIASIAGPGAVLAEDGVVAQVTIAEDTVVARADVLQADSFAAGSSVTVRAGSAALDAKVAQLSGFKDGDLSKNEVPGKDITLPLPAGTQGFAADQSVTLTAGAAAPESLAVPLIAIRQESGTAFVEVEASGGLRRVDVKVTAQADGWAALADVEGLAVGDRVKLP
jgi:hypothetical protein